MLLQFNFKNFKSFKDDTTLDMTSTKISEHEEHIIKLGGENILPVAAIFGANASGKTNVIEAFKYMHLYVINSFGFGGELTKKEKGEFLKPTPFIFDSKSGEAESSFEVYFIDNTDKKEKTYNYGFTIDAKGVVEEWLNVTAKTSKDPNRIFYRNRKEGVLDLSSFDNKTKDNLSAALEDETLIVSLGSKLKIEKLKLIRDWFFKNECTNFGEPSETYFLSTITPANFAYDENVRKNVIKYLSSFDDSIVDFKVEVVKGENRKDDRLTIDSVHKTIDGKGYAHIPFKNESAGTLKLFALYQFLNNALSNGGVLFVDELNAKLHPLLVRVFVQTFLNKELNPHNAQLIFTTHDTWQLNSKILRRDEIWFTDKQDTGVSNLYSLVDFVDTDGGKIRKDENYEKNYLLGKYGAIPTLKFFDLFMED